VFRPVDDAVTPGGGRPLTRQRQTTIASRRERRLAERSQRSDQPRARTGANPIWRSPIVVMTALALVAGAAIIGFVVATSPATPAATGALIRPPDSPAAKYAPGAGESTGPETAPVVLDVYSDFQCPGCGNFAKSGLPGIVNEFVATGELRIVDHAVDILGRADPSESTNAAVAATCAGNQGKYWQYHDYLFWNQRGENQGAFSAARLAQMADAVGVDRGKWDSCIKDDAIKAEIKGRAKAAAISSTPTFVLNGQQVTGLQSYSDLADRIKALIPAASGSASVAPTQASSPSGEASSTP
jgi:protein-disulfide isomerase